MSFKMVIKDLLTYKRVKDIISKNRLELDLIIDSLLVLETIVKNKLITFTLIRNFHKKLLIRRNH